VEKDKKALANDLKMIYHALDEATGYEQKHDVAEKWENKYLIVMMRWEDFWDSLTTMFKFSSDFRKVTYTINAIESFNSVYRRLNRQRSVFPTVESLQKSLYLATWE
jgi:putative transposase